MKLQSVKKTFKVKEWNLLFLFIRFWMAAIVTISFGVSNIALSQETQSSNHQSNTGATPVLTAVTPSSSQSTRRLAIQTSFGFSTNLAELNSLENSSNLDLEISPQYTLNSKQSITGSFSVSKELQGEQTLSLINDAVIVFSQKGPAIGKNISSGISLQETIPLSKDSRERDSLLSSVTIRPGLSLKTKYGNFGYKLGITRHLHAFTSTTYGKSNFKWGLGNSLSYGTQFTEKLGFSLSLSFNNAWTYLGALSQNFSGVEELSYDVSSAAAVSIGHRNAGSAIKADGVTSNLEIFNSNNSIIYTSFSYNF